MPARSSGQRRMIPFHKAKKSKQTNKVSTRGSKSVLPFFCNLFSKPISLLIPLVLLLLGQGLAKWGSTLSLQQDRIISFPHILSYLCLLFRGFLWILILKNIPLILAYSVFSLQYILVLFVGILFFAEKVSLSQGLGTLLIVGGVVLCGLGEKRNV